MVFNQIASVASTFVPKRAIPADAIELRPLPSVTRTASRDISHDEQVCPISFEPISSYAAKDIFTTLDKQKYHLPSLKFWLQNHDTMPHNNLPSPREIERIWPGSTTGIKAEGLKLPLKKALPVAGALAVAGLGSIGAGIYAISRAYPVVNSSNEQLYVPSIQEINSFKPLGISIIVLGAVMIGASVTLVMRQGVILHPNKAQRKLTASDMRDAGALV